MSLSFQCQSPIPTSAHKLYDWHASGGAFERLCPPWQDIRVQEWRGGEKTASLNPMLQFGDISKGTRVCLKNYLGPFSVRIEAEHVEHDQGRFFIDEMRRGPFAYWRHTHRFIPQSENSSVLEDSVSFELPLRRLTSFARDLAHAELSRMFAFRHWRTLRDIRLHNRWQHLPRQKVLIVGSGELAHHIGAFLRNGGHHVHYLTETPLKQQPHTLWNSIESVHLAMQDIDTLIVCKIGSALKQNLEQGHVLKTIPTQDLNAVIFLCESLDDDDYIGTQTRTLSFGVPSVWDGGHLCFASRHRISNTKHSAWCALDDLLGGIERGMYDANWQGSFSWQAPSPIDISMIQRHGLAIKGLPFSIPSWFAQRLYPDLFTDEWGDSKIDYDWIEAEFSSEPFRSS